MKRHPHSTPDADSPQHEQREDYQPMDSDPLNLTTSQVIHKTGVTQRQLRYWACTGLLMTRPQKRSWLLWPPVQVRRVEGIAHLLERGLTLQQIRTLMNHPTWNLQTKEWSK